MKKSTSFLLALTMITVLLSSCAASFPAIEKAVSLTSGQAEDLLKGKTETEIRRNWGEPDSHLSGFYGDIYVHDHKQIVIYYDPATRQVSDVIIEDR